MDRRIQYSADCYYRWLFIPCFGGQDLVLRIVVLGEGEGGEEEGEENYSSPASHTALNHFIALAQN